MQHPTPRRLWHHNSRQHVLLEYANLKNACPEGIYLSLTPGEPARWSGILFVRGGPYASAILRFLIFFPVRYPYSPPLVTFVTDIFHPLVTPLTTYTYTTGSPSSDPVSATDDERLPPGGFSLSNAFPHWFAKAEQSVPSSVNSSRDVSTSADDNDRPNRNALAFGEYKSWLPPGQRGPQISIIDVLDYVKRAFDEDQLLDELPLQAAANIGAWKARRAYRHEALQRSGEQQTSNGSPIVAQTTNTIRKPQLQAKHLDEWSWDGVWKERVRKGIDVSNSDQVLFGASGGDEIIRFIDTKDVSDSL